MSRKARLSISTDNSEYDTQSAVCELLFPVRHISKRMKKNHIASTTSQKATIFMTAVLEYLAAELLDIAGEVAKLREKTLIKPSHIRHAISQDEELNTLLGDICIRGASHGIELAKLSGEISQSESEIQCNSSSNEEENELSDEDLV